MVYPLQCYEFIYQTCLVRMYSMYVPMYSMYACKQNKFPEMDNKLELNQCYCYICTIKFEIHIVYQ